jgi:hypothetical protein
MEYYRYPKNQIQADFAYRLGMIANQYRTLSLPTKKDFSVTLDVCILQNLLTTCTELLNPMKTNERRANYLTADIGMGLAWGLRPEMIELNTFLGQQLTGDVVLRRLRNALSHPTTLDIDDEFPSSGYTTIEDGSGTIRRYCFVNSPDTKPGRPEKPGRPKKPGRPRTFSTEKIAEDELKREGRAGDMPKDVGVIRYGADKFCFGLGGKPFARIFKLYLTPDEIHALVIGLSNHLAQPIQEDWDGFTVATLVA